MSIRNIHHTATIGKNVIIECNSFNLGANSIIKDNCIIRCNNFNAGEGLYMCEGVEIGRGGCFGPNSNVYIGTNVGIFEKTIINPSEEVHIGNNVGIGGEVMIWTHGAWLDVMQGFPADFGPVHIGDNVWLPARSIVLPNVTIGENTVIGIGSVINRNLPKGCFAAGTPCKVIKENCYPKKLNKKEKETIVNNILEDWKVLLKHKEVIDVIVYYDEEDDSITLTQFNYDTTIFNLENKTMEGFINNISEDLRDYLRRRSIKIYTKDNFKSI
tara:strand:- start:51 stop:863 length:813 start_codon:yes stop_codon:yes gene_type:complete